MTAAQPSPTPSRFHGSHVRTGQAGEELVTQLLERAGWRILHRNWRPERSRSGVRGELDIIAQRDGRATVFEVKTRTGNGFGHPAEAVTPQKLRRLHRLARVWATEQGSAAVPGVDVVSVHWPAGQAPCVEHVGSLSWH